MVAIANTAEMASNAFIRRLTTGCIILPSVIAFVEAVIEGLLPKVGGERRSLLDGRITKGVSAVHLLAVQLRLEWLSRCLCARMDASASCPIMGGSRG